MASGTTQTRDAFAESPIGQGRIYQSLIFSTVPVYSFSSPIPTFFFFLGSSRNDFNYLHNQMLIAASGKCVVIDCTDYFL